MNLPAGLNPELVIGNRDPKAKVDKSPEVVKKEVPVLLTLPSPLVHTLGRVHDGLKDLVVVDLVPNPRDAAPLDAVKLNLRTLKAVRLLREPRLGKIVYHYPEGEIGVDCP